MAGRPKGPDSCIKMSTLRKLFEHQRTTRRIPLLSRWSNDLRFFWHTKIWRGQDTWPWVILLLIGFTLSMFVAINHGLKSNSAEKRELTCLALNVYYEARGESQAGKYAVAEVTMNRVVSRRFPETVCDVVYEKRWDYLRKRYVGAFSWTEFDRLDDPEGNAWDEAREVAEAIYLGRHPPQLSGALHYHAYYIKPSWARGQEPVARIGGHVFYK